MPSPKQVLFIAYLFPPGGGAGVQRTLKFVKFLPEAGWQPAVLTVNKKALALQDPGLLAEVPAHTPVHRTSTLLLPSQLPFRLRKWFSRWFLLVDEQIGWYPFAVRQGLKLTEKVQAIYSTSAPYTDHLVGLRLKRQTGLPWIADFRDAWIGNFTIVHPTNLHRRAVESLERKVIVSADQVVVVSEPMRSDLIGRYPDEPNHKFVYLPNGFDPEDFAQPISIEKRSDCFTIAYTGSFYMHGRSPVPFFQAIKAAFEQGFVPRQRLYVNLVGNIGYQVQKSVQEMQLQDCVHFTGYLEHKMSIGYLRAADVLLLLVGDSADSVALLPGKIFEYLAANRPILALGPEGVAAGLVREAQAGWVVPANDVAAITAQLVELYRKWEQGELTIQPRLEVIARYDRRLQAHKLAELLDEITPQTEAK